MIILTIRTDKPEAELGLYDDNKPQAYEAWLAHRQLAETIHLKLRDILADNGQRLKGLGGVVAYLGPGSFTGLRIGLSVANALADGLGIAVVGAQGGSWQAKGIDRLLAGERDEPVLPEYGAPVHITPPKK